MHTQYAFFSFLLFFFNLFFDLYVSEFEPMESNLICYHFWMCEFSIENCLNARVLFDRFFLSFFVHSCLVRFMLYVCACRFHSRMRTFMWTKDARRGLALSIVDKQTFKYAISNRHIQSKIIISVCALCFEQKIAIFISGTMKFWLFILFSTILFFILFIMSLDTFLCWVFFLHTNTQSVQSLRSALDRNSFAWWHRSRCGKKASQTR